jgi:hypothetical protein
VDRETAVPRENDKVYKITPRYAVEGYVYMLYRILSESIVQSYGTSAKLWKSDTVE